MPERAVARVVVDSPLPQLDRLFDYEIPERLADLVRPGVRVRVPVRSAGRIMDGWVVEVSTDSAYAGALSPVEDVVSPLPVLAPEVWTLARRVADRAAGTASDVLRLAVPPRSVRAEQAVWPVTDAAAVVDAAVAEPPSAGRPAPPAVSGYPVGVLEVAVAAGERVALTAIPGVVAMPAVGGATVTVGAWARTLAQLAAHAVAAGRTAILVAPDHRDLDQLESAVGAVVGADLLVRLDAAQTTPVRYHGYLRARRQSGLVVIGSRSAVYAPAERLGLLAIWDDGDPLHREPHAPGVHVRDVALVRHELQGAALVIGGHAVTAEAQRLVEIGWCRAIDPAARSVPAVRPTALATGVGADDHARIPSLAWRGVREALATGPVLVQVGRPGYSPQLVCATCAEPARCGVCAGPLGSRVRGGAPHCGWCGAVAAGWRCGQCAGSRLRAGVAGSVRTADELGRAFPKTRVVLADGERTLLRVDASPALVVATRGAEPVADGGYRAILLLDGERMLAREGLRVAEDCVRWWSNAIALGAPDATTWLVGVGGRLAAGLAGWQQRRLAAEDLLARRSLRFPPAVRVATVTGTADAVADAVAALRLPPADVLGPVGVDAVGVDPAGSGTVRTIIRFDYQRGPAVASALRAAVIRSAAARRAVARAAGRPAGTRAALDLRVRMDDVGAFDPE